VNQATCHSAGVRPGAGERFRLIAVHRLGGVGTLRFLPKRFGNAKTGWHQRNLDLPGTARDGLRVNMKTLGKLLIAALFCTALVGRSSSSHDGPVPLGNDTFSITHEARTAFSRDTDKLKDEATAEAQKFCEAQGKQMRVISLTTKLPTFSLGYPSATIVFRALPPGDPGLTDPLPTAGSAGGTAVAVEAPKSIVKSTEDLYDALLKLDDLRKKGILTDEEFQAEKKKVLSRSN